MPIGQCMEVNTMPYLLTVKQISHVGDKLTYNFFIITHKVAPHSHNEDLWRRSDIPSSILTLTTEEWSASHSGRFNRGGSNSRMHRIGGLVGDCRPRCGGLQTHSCSTGNRSQVVHPIATRFAHWEIPISILILPRLVRHSDVNGVMQIKQ